MQEVKQLPLKEGWYLVLFQDLEMWAYFWVFPNQFARQWSLPDRYITHWQQAEPLLSRPLQLPDHLAKDN